MSREHVEIVRRGWEAYNQGDIDGLLEPLDPECEFHEDPAFPEAGVYRGPEEIKAYLLQFREAMADHSFEVEEVRDFGSAVIALLHERARGKASGVEVDIKPAFLHRFRDDKLVWVRGRIWTETKRWQTRRAAPSRSPRVNAEPAGRDTALVASENVELVRRGFEAAFQRPKPDFDTLNALFQAEHEHISAASRVDGGTSLRGAPAFREWLDNIEGAFELWTASTEEIRGLDDEHVLVTGELNAVGRRSGVPVKQDFVVVMTVRDGKISRTESFASREDALKAVRPDR